MMDRVIETLLQYVKDQCDKIILTAFWSEVEPDIPYIFIGRNRIRAEVVGGKLEFSCSIYSGRFVLKSLNLDDPKLFEHINEYLFTLLMRQDVKLRLWMVE